jgi:glycyl-tRNA synthetase
VPLSAGTRSGLNSSSLWEKEESITGERFIPHVAEPSFGADRLTYLTLECSYKREGRSHCPFTARSIAPVKVWRLSLVNRRHQREGSGDIRRYTR